MKSNNFKKGFTMVVLKQSYNSGTKSLKKFHIDATKKFKKVP